VLKRQTCWLLAALVPAVAAWGQERPAGLPAPGLPVIKIAGRPNTRYESLQAAIDAAPADAAIEIGAGRCDERVTITKNLQLVGAGADATVLGPTADRQAARRDEIAAIWQALDAASRAAEDDDAQPLDDDQRAELTRRAENLKRLHAEYLAPVVLIEQGATVELRGLKVTLPDAPREGEGLQGDGAVTVKRANVRLVDCAVVGCLSGGVYAEDGSKVEIVDSLVAGCWSSGVSAFNRHQGELTITGSEIRNNYHNNVWSGSGACRITGCRISGSAWFGIRTGDVAPRIERNAIFDNARAAIYAETATGAARQNLICRNQMGGVAIWAPSEFALEENVFLDNVDAAVFVNGPARPSIVRNVFARSAAGVRLGPLRLPKAIEPPATDVQLVGNLFAGVEQPLTRWKPAEGDQPEAHAPLELPADAGNRLVDAELRLGERQRLVIGPEFSQDGVDRAAVAQISLESQWELTPEEQAMIPDGPSREWSKWKMRPK
jgi:hypothetical protein